jgi:hypothetical protein
VWHGIGERPIRPKIEHWGRKMTEVAAPVPDPQDYGAGESHEDLGAASQEPSPSHHDAPPEPATPATTSTSMDADFQSQVQQLEHSDPQLVQELQQEDQIAQQYGQSDPQLAQEITQEEQVQLEEADPQLATEMMVEAATNQDVVGGNGTPPEGQTSPPEHSGPANPSAAPGPPAPPQGAVPPEPPTPPAPPNAP